MEAAGIASLHAGSEIWDGPPWRKVLERVLLVLGVEVGLVVGQWAMYPLVSAREEGYCREMRETKLERGEIVEPLNAKFYIWSAGTLGKEKSLGAFEWGLHGKAVITSILGVSVPITYGGKEGRQRETDRKYSASSDRWKNWDGREFSLKFTVTSFYLRLWLVWLIFLYI